MKKTLLLLPALLWAFLASAQIVNIENARIKNDTTGLDGNLNLGLGFIQNEALLINLRVNGVLQYKTRQDLFLLVGDVGFNGSPNLRYNDYGLAHLRYNRKLNKWLRWEAFGQIQYNNVQGLQMRTLLGTGPRFKCVENKKLKLYVGAAAVLEREHESATDSIFLNYRESSYVSWTWAPLDNLSFVGTTYFQPRFDAFWDYRISGQYSLVFRIFKNITFRSDFSFALDQNPPPGIRKFSLGSSNGFGIAF
jgi:hypothetical protein